MTSVDVLLPDTWTYHFHDPTDRDWTLKSYVRLASVSSVSDMWQVQAAVQKRISEGMFFVMREDVFPCWDDPANVNGGCISIKIPKHELPALWEALLMRVLGEDVFSGIGDFPVVNGLSTSPKRNHCIVKIWVDSNKCCGVDHLRLPARYTGQVMYTSSVDMMQNSVRSDATGRA